MGIVAAAASSSATTLRTYFVGNSVTDTINYQGLVALAAGRGHSLPYGRHMIPGAPLQWIWDHPGDGFQEPPYGYYPNALPNYTWDVISLQPFDRQLDGADGDVAMVSNYLGKALLRAENNNAQLYIYSRWPRRPETGGVFGPFNFQALWDRTYTGGWDGTNESRDFFVKLLARVRTNHPGLTKKPLLVPVGDVLYELDKRMKAGQVPGYTDIVQLYSDGIHFNNVGSFLVGTTYYATLFKNDPAGQVVPSQYGSIPVPIVQAIQDVVWDIVSVHPLAGVLVTPAPVTGKVTLEDYIGATLPPVTVQLKQGATEQTFANVALSPSGGFSVNSSLRGSLEVRVKFPTSVRRLLGSVALTDAGAAVGSGLLLNGDCDGDNSVTVFDYDVLSQAFDATSGGAGYNAAADLDGDGSVTVFDYDLLSRNFDLTGD